MGWTCKIYPELELGVVWLRGDAVGKDVLAGIASLYTDEQWKPGFSTLWDARKVEFIEPKDVDLESISLVSASLSRQGRGKLAVVVRNNHTGLMADLILQRRNPNDRPASVFLDMAEALTWLGIAEPPPEIKLVESTSIPAGK
jgi:hypothetical protein